MSAPASNGWVVSTPHAAQRRAAGRRRQPLAGNCSLDHLSACSAAVAVFFVLLAGPGVAEASSTRTCALLLSEARFELEDSREVERLAPIILAADQAVFNLFEPLWEAHLTERLQFLGAKHARDRSQLHAERAKIATRRATAKIDVLAQECLSHGPGADDPLVRFGALGCELVGKDKEIAALDVAYTREVLHSTAELRRRELATAQDLVRAKFSVERAESELRSRANRLAECEPRPTPP